MAERHVEYIGSIGNLRTLKSSDLLALLTDVLSVLQERGVTRTENIPTGDYAEWLVSEAMGMKLMANSNSGYDAIDASGQRVQIKARRIRPQSLSLQLGTIRDYQEKQFDYLIALVFDERYALVRAFKIRHENIEQYALVDKHQNGLRLYVNKICQDPNVEDITEQLAQSGKCAVSSSGSYDRLFKKPAPRISTDK